MRESFGGAFMIRLVLIFIVLYISFMAVAVNYAKVFRIKNHIINMLEQHQYNYKVDGKDTTSGVIKKIDEYLDDVHYTVDDTNTSNDCTNNKSGVWVPHGACIVPDKSCTEDSCYYKVIVYIVIDFPFEVEGVANVNNLPISGETKTIVY